MIIEVLLSVNYHERYSPRKDIDLDLDPSKRPRIFEEIRKERGELGLLQVATFGSETTKSAILTACRGYRSEEFPNGIDVDIAQYLSSLVPAERGFLWPLNDVVQGNPEKGRKPVKTFMQEVDKYPGLLGIMQGIESLVNKRSSHASGVVLFDKEPYEICGIMRTPSWDLITSYDLHDLEYTGGTKYDFLLTEVSSKLGKCSELLQKYGEIEKGELREVYNKYLHPSVIDINNEKIWNALGGGNVLDVFQFSTGVGLNAAKKIKPQSICEMSNANSIMRLMADKGKESPLDRYCRLKRDISQWYAEMDRYGLSKEEQKILEPYYLPAYGTPPQQEQLMRILMDTQICGFSLKDANAARKTVAKKKMNEIPALREHVFSSCKNKNLAQYVWDTGIAPQLGYSFSELHSTAYSWVGVQTLVLATSFNPVYWDTACLIVNSGAMDAEENNSTDYAKMAKAIASIKEKNIKISLADINSSEFGFKPDIAHNQILFGLKSMLNVSSELVADIVNNRPYNNLYDFIEKVPSAKKQAIIALIKGGAFDSFGDRKLLLASYIWSQCDKKKKLTLSNFSTLIKHGLIPDDLDFVKRVFNFNKYLKTYCNAGDKYVCDARAANFLLENFADDVEDKIQDNQIILDVKYWKKLYDNEMALGRDYIKAHEEELLEKLNDIIFSLDWEKYTDNKGISHWEMEVLCFYYHEHELAHVDKNLYGVSDFNKLPETPIVANVFRRGGREIPLYRIDRIIGTCIAKDKTKGYVTLLTTDGIANVKFSKEYFSMFDKQISEVQKDGKKKIMEKSWFNRGEMIMVQGFRRGDDFVAKKYARTPGHMLYKITRVDADGTIVLTHERYSSDKTIEEETNE